MLNIHRGEFDLEQLRFNYKRAVRDNHPDRFTDPEIKQKADERMAVLNEAFRVLSDSNERLMYDHWINQQEDEKQPSKEDNQLEKYVPSDSPEMDFIQGMSALTEGMIEKAVYYFKWAHFKNPEYYAAQFFLGRAYLMMESSFELVGRHHIEEALKKDPTLSKFSMEGWSVPKVGGLYMRLHKKKEEATSRLEETLDRSKFSFDS
jgi:hypothetical protein